MILLIVLIARSTITALSSHTVLLRGNTCETFLNRGVAVQIFLPLTVIAMAVCESPPTALQHVQTASLTTSFLCWMAGCCRRARISWMRGVTAMALPGSSEPFCPLDRCHDLAVLPINLYGGRVTAYQGEVLQGTLEFQRLTLSNLQRGAPTYWCAHQAACAISCQP